MIHFFTLVIISFMLSIPNSALGQSCKDVYKALKKIEAKTQIGISYIDYRRELGDVQYELNLFLEGKQAKQKPEITEHLKKAMMHYLNAAKVWEMTAEKGNIGFYSPYVKYANPTDIDKYFFKIYPKALDKLSNIRGPGYEKEIYYTDLLTIIWNEASNELKKVASLLSK